MCSSYVCVRVCVCVCVCAQEGEKGKEKAHLCITDTLTFSERSKPSFVNNKMRVLDCLKTGGKSGCKHHFLVSVIQIGKKKQVGVVCVIFISYHRSISYSYLYRFRVCFHIIKTVSCVLCFK